MSKKHVKGSIGLGLCALLYSLVGCVDSAALLAQATQEHLNRLAEVKKSPDEFLADKGVQWDALLSNMESLVAEEKDEQLLKVASDIIDMTKDERLSEQLSKAASDMGDLSWDLNDPYGYFGKSFDMDLADKLCVLALRFTHYTANRLGMSSLVSDIDFGNYRSRSRLVDQDYVSSQLDGRVKIFKTRELAMSARYSYAVTELLLKRALVIREKSAPDQQKAMLILEHLGYLYLEQGRSSEAETVFGRALAMHEMTKTKSGLSTELSQNEICNLDPFKLFDDSPISAGRSPRDFAPAYQEAVRSVFVIFSSDTSEYAKSSVADYDKALKQRKDFMMVGLLTHSPGSHAGLADLSRETRTALFARDAQTTPIRQARRSACNPQYYEEGFRLAERIKAKNLRAEMAERQAIETSGLPAAEAARLRELTARRDELDARIGAASGTEVGQALRQARDAAQVELDQLDVRLRQEFPRYREASQAKAVTVEASRKVLPPDSVFVSFLLDSQGQGIALALPQQGNLQVVDLSGKGQELLRRLQTYRRLVAAPDPALLRAEGLKLWRDGGEYWVAEHYPGGGKAPSAAEVEQTAYAAARREGLQQQGQWLAEALLQPLHAQIGAPRTWILAPDGELATLPWDTLPWQGQSLGQSKQITLVYSLSMYAQLAQRRQDDSRDRPRTLLAMGGPAYSLRSAEPCQQTSATQRRAVSLQRKLASQAPAEGEAGGHYYDQMLKFAWEELPCATVEAESVSKLLNGKLYLGAEASEAKLRQLAHSGELGQYRYLHFAAHAYLNTLSPNFSALVLTRTGAGAAEDGYVTAAEWPALALKSDLVVMSACETALGKAMHGEGVMGLPYALYLAGNRDALLTLWKVSDEGSLLFMQRFWGKLAGGATPAAAVRETKREMLSGQLGAQYQDPFYWGPFVLYGLAG